MFQTTNQYQSVTITYPAIHRGWKMSVLKKIVFFQDFQGPTVNLPECKNFWTSLIAI